MPNCAVLLQRAFRSGNFPLDVRGWTSYSSYCRNVNIPVAYTSCPITVTTAGVNQRIIIDRLKCSVRKTSLGNPKLHKYEQAQPVRTSRRQQILKHSFSNRSLHHRLPPSPKTIHYLVEHPQCNSRPSSSLS
jgi:hypothetical protein